MSVRATASILSLLLFAACTSDDPGASPPPVSPAAGEGQGALEPPTPAPAGVDDTNPDAAAKPVPKPVAGAIDADQPIGEQTGAGEPTNAGDATTPAGTDQLAATNIADPQPIGDPGVDTIVAFVREQKIDRARPGWKLALPQPPLDVKFDANKQYYWKLTTNQGDMELRLMPSIAPRHVANLVYLTELGYYDGIIFHRVIQNFMAQGGCPLGTGSGNPGYQFDAEFHDQITHDRRGQLSAANSGPGTDGSQFFITFAAQPGLNGKHTIFGALTSGSGTLRKIEAMGAPSDPGVPSGLLRIESATIEVRSE